MIYPRGFYPWIISVSTSPSSRGRISKMHSEKKRRGYIYPVRQNLPEYIVSVSQIWDSGDKVIYDYETSRIWRILVKRSRPFVSRADNRGINVPIFRCDKRLASPTQVQPFNHATRSDCVVVRAWHEVQNAHSHVHSHERRVTASSAPVGALKSSVDLKLYWRPFRTRITAGWRSSWALIELSLGRGGLYSDPIIVFGFEYNLPKYPVPKADIPIRISAEGVVCHQIWRIGVYPHPITAQRTYPDNPWYQSKSSYRKHDTGLLRLLAACAVASRMTGKVCGTWNAQMMRFPIHKALLRQTLPVQQKEHRLRRASWSLMGAMALPENLDMLLIAKHPSHIVL